MGDDAGDIRTEQPTKEEFQRGCIEGYFKPRAEILGLELDVEYTDEGYRIKISKK